MAARTPSSRRLLAVLCLASAGWAFSFGLGVPLAALWLESAGCSQKSIGLNTSAYYFGVAATSLVLPWLMRRSGRRCVVAGMVVDGLVTALFPLGMALPGWLLLRLLAGVATALSLIPMETLVNHNAPPDRRAGDFGVYAVCVALGIGLGALVGVPLFALTPYGAFALGGVVALASAALAWRELPAKETYAEQETARARLSFGENALSYGTAWVQGALEAGMFTFLSGYLFALGYSEGGVTGLLAVLFLGVVALQMPLAQLADRLGRTRLLLGCHAAALLSVTALAFCTGPWTLGGGLFFAGACCAALYPLGLAVLGERTPAAALGKANAWYLASNCVGSLTGPVVTGAAMDLFGRRAQFGAAAASVLLAGCVWGAVRWLRRGRVRSAAAGVTGAADFRDAA